MKMEIVMRLIIAKTMKMKMIMLRAMIKAKIIATAMKFSLLSAITIFSL